MFLSTYLSSLSALINQQNLPRYASLMYAGNWAKALQSLQHQRENQGAGNNSRSEEDTQALCAIGDAMLISGNLEEAEENYRLVHKCSRTNVRQLRLLSCRNTAWQMLTQHRFSVALNCFSQIDIDDKASVNQRAEALVGKAMTHFHLGQGVNSLQVISQAKDLLYQEDTSLGYLLEALYLDILAQLSMRRSPRLADHVFWQATGFGKDVLDATVDADEFLRLASQLEPSHPLIAKRLDFLRIILLISAGDVMHFQRAMYAVPNVSSGTSALIAQNAKLELAIAALAAGRADLAERAVTGIGNRNSFRWDLDLDYCQSKIAQSRGRTEHALRLYYRYAMDAVHCLRNEAHQPRPSHQNETTSVNDDISARLPAKYRRAYAFMIANAHRPDLSVNEVAAQVGVTGRALQLAFKSATGFSPTQVLRRYRMQGIRADLLADGGCGGVLQAASRWGVASRSALAKGYRQQFNEAPVDTLQR